MSLFQKSVINKYLKTLNSEVVENSFLRFKKFYGNVARLENIRLLKEENYQEGFLREIFVQVLGYKINPDENYNLTTEFKNLTDAKKADGAILADGKAIGVIELKSTKTTSLESITDQAFNYKNHQTNCRYIITSNFEKIRFYVDNATDFEEFNLFTLSEDEFKILYLILSKESIFNEIPLKLKKESVLHEENISKQLYQDYSNFKRNIFENLVKNNPQFDKLTLFKKSQKLLDRFLFVLFGEDSGLVPPNAVSKIIDQWKTLTELDEPVTIYSRFVKLFHHLDVGHKYKTFEIPAYNGGLFQADKMLDEFQIDDDILLNDSLKLSSYDFQTEIDVNILGHIFENSLNEIEELTAELEGKTVDKKKTKRKKEGIYYTPKYITKYIVENTVGELCKQKKKELKLDAIDISIIQNSRTKQGKLNRKAFDLLDRLKLYSDYLLSLKILDPACGSGAFLNQALELLIEEHQFVDEIRRQLEKDSLGLFNIKKSILENNIYGVDINEESVEIAKLSLWLRTAERGRKLSNLSNNIKCGNSLIDDPEVAGEKAFKWDEEFPEIMANGGFDVVIGNPPYTYRNAISDIEKKYYKENFNSTEGNFDLYKFFIERLSHLSKLNGFCSLIVPNTFLTAATYKKLRKIILDTFSILEIFDLGLSIFEDVVVESIVFTFQKNLHRKKLTKVKIQRNRNNYFLNLEKEHKISFIDSLSDDFTFNIYLSNEIKKLTDKIWIDSVPLQSICYCTVGINTGYIKNEMTSNSRIDSRYHKMLNGKHIGRNYVAWAGEWIMYDSDFVKSYGDRGRTLPPEYVFTSDKILVQRTRRGMVRKLVCYYDDEKFYNLNRLSNIVLENNEYNLKYIYALMNSLLLDFYFNKVFNEYEVKPLHLSKLPIKKCKISIQTQFSVKADLILNSNKQINLLAKNFLNRIKTNLETFNITNKLKSFYDYDFSIFLVELKKQKIVLSLKQQDDWEEYFNERKSEINSHQNQVYEVDKKIDQMVYELYGLNEEEIQIVEKSFE